MNLDPRQSGWAVQLHPDCHVLGARLVGWPRTPPPPAQSPAARAKGRSKGGDEEGVPGGLGPSSARTEGAAVRDTCRGCLSRKSSPQDLRLSLRLCTL